MTEEVATDCQETAVTVAAHPRPAAFAGHAGPARPPPARGHAPTPDCAWQAIEKSPNYEAASKMLQEDLSKKYGGGWHVVMGEGAPPPLLCRLSVARLTVRCRGRLWDGDHA